MDTITYRCRHCGDELVPVACSGEYGHVDLCCDCYDLSWGAPLDLVNEERAKKGKQPAPPWNGVK